MLLLILLIFSPVLAQHYRVDKVFYSEDDAELHFELFIKTHNKTYNNEMEKKIRFEIFRDNLIDINELNRQHIHSTYAINQFADLTTEEFLMKHTGLDPALGDGTESCRVLDDSALSSGAAPAAYDWREHLNIQIKNQYSCRSCWAFSATGSVEAQYELRYKKSISLSEQQIVDCDKNDNGCIGGFPASALRYLIQTGGQEPESVYPYVNQKRQCKFTPGQARVRVTDCITFKFSNEDMIKEALVKYGPLTGAVDSRSFQKYHGGILTSCPNNGLDHAIMIVGYGTDKATGKDFWIIKNSWSKTWGEQGFLRIERGVNACGILNTFISTSVIL